jgi:hypothetical protein
MNDMSTLANPFRTWAELARGLHNRVMKEMGEGPQMASPDMAEFLGSLAGLATDCDRIGQYLRRVQERDPDAFNAFLRALETS